MQPLNLNLNRSFAWSAISLAFIALVLVFTAPPLLVAAFTASPDELQVASALEDHLAAHDKAMDVYRARFDGRAVFYKPLPTPRYTPPPPKPPTRETEPAPAPTRPKPDPISPTYTGPSIMAILGNEVWFSNPRPNEPPMIISVGEEDGGVEVLAVDPPWSARLRYRRGEYDVSLFELKEFLSESPERPVPPPPGLVEVPPKAADNPPADTGSAPDASPKSKPPDADNTEAAGNQSAPRKSGGNPPGEKSSSDKPRPGVTSDATDSPAASPPGRQRPDN